MLLDELNAIAEKTKAGRKQICVSCCMSAGCMSSRADEIKKALEKAVADRNLGEKIEVRRVGCMSFCGEGPLVSVKSEGLLYQQVTPENAPSIIEALDGGATDVQVGDPNHPFLARQKPVVGANMGLIDPEKIEDYIARAVTPPSTTSSTISPGRRWSRPSPRAVSADAAAPGSRPG